MIVEKLRGLALCTFLFTALISKGAGRATDSAAFTRPVPYSVIETESSDDANDGKSSPQSMLDFDEVLQGLIPHQVTRRSVRETRNDALRHALRIRRSGSGYTLGHALRIKKDAPADGSMMYNHAFRIKKDAPADGSMMYNHAFRIKKDPSAMYNHAFRIKRDPSPMYNHALRIKKYVDGDEDPDYDNLMVWDPYLKRGISRTHILRAI